MRVGVQHAVPCGRAGLRSVLGQLHAALRQA